MVRYDRFMCDEFLDWLSDKSKLNFLITEFQTYNKDHDPFALDMHIREKNALHVYHGGREYWPFGKRVYTCYFLPTGLMGKTIYQAEKTIKTSCANGTHQRNLSLGN